MTTGVEANDSRNHDGPHAWSAWMPRDSSSHYRQCKVTFCAAVEVRKVGS